MMAELLTEGAVLAWVVLVLGVTGAGESRI